MPLTPEQRGDILRILEHALRAVDPQQAVHRQLTLDGPSLTIGGQIYDLTTTGRVFVVGAGKASAPMAAAVQDLLGSRINGGIVNVKHGHLARGGGWRLRLTSGVQEDRNGRSSRSHSGHSSTPKPAEASTPVPPPGPITFIEAGHPVPDAAGQAGAARIASLLTGLTERDLVIVLLSGGGSALLPLPVEGLTLDDYRRLTDLLLRSGADITEINTIRKHCSRLQGGRLAQIAAPARVVSLILSDVVGSPLDAIASGPTVPDPTTYADAWAILERYALLDHAPVAVVAHLKRGEDGQLPETPKPGDPLFARVQDVIIGDNAIAGRAAVTAARALGFQSVLLSSFIQGEAREVGRVLAGLAQGIVTGQSDFIPPACVVLGGETTVTLRGAGQGGRNQELALAAGIALSSQPVPPGVSVAVVSLGTDGTDGPTDAAGGIGTADLIARAARFSLDPRASLANNDSYPCLGALGDLLVSGPTGTNVNDLMLVMVWGPDAR